MIKTPAQHREHIRALQSDISMIKQRIRNGVRPLYEDSIAEDGRVPFVFMEIGGEWECPQSPFGLCLYDAYDAVHDHCIYCHYPEERK